MHVRDLQSFLRGLIQPLKASGAKTVGRELDMVTDALTPFSDWKLPQFADFLGKAEEYARTGIVPAGTKGRAGKSPARATDPAAVEQAVSTLESLLNNVAQDTVTYEGIQTAVKKVAGTLTKPGVLAVAKGLGIPGSFKTKKAAVYEIEHLLATRKESYERTRF